MKVIIAIPIQQHSYEQAKALQKSGDLDTYITSIYYKKGNLTELTSRFLPGELKGRAQARHVDGLPDHMVRQYCELDNLYVSFLCRYMPELYLKATRRFRDRFCIKIKKFIEGRNPDLVIAYDDCSPILFEWMKDELPEAIRVLDVGQANPIYMKDIYERDFQLSPEFADLLKEERDFCWNSELLERQCREYQAAQYFLAGSEFVRKSLVYSGIKDSTIYTVRYGVDLNAFTLKKFSPGQLGNKVRFLYVGGTKELKGIAYLLKAYQKLDHTKAELTIVGTNNLSEKLMQRYCKDVRFTGNLPFNEMPSVYQDYDVFVFPSLGDGFGLVILEAMASGLPVIATENCGGPEVIEESRDGFVIPIQNEDILADRMQWFIEHREEIPKMGQYAANAVRRQGDMSLGWETYYRQIVQTIRAIADDYNRSKQ